jgi:hypothetical protein
MGASPLRKEHPRSDNSSLMEMPQKQKNFFPGYEKYAGIEQATYLDFEEHPRNS